MGNFKEIKLNSTLSTAALGLGLRRELRTDVLDFIRRQKDEKLIEWLEIVPENYISKGGKAAKQFEEVLASGIPLIPHGVNLSIGTANSITGKPAYDPELIKAMKELFKLIDPPWFSDHIACSRIDDYYLQELIPVPFTEEAVEVLSTNIKFLQDEFERPFLIENPSYYSTLIKPEMSEAEFINAILEKSDCGMLLDINNVFVNSINHNYDAKKFLSEINLDRVVQVHIAGHLEGYTADLLGSVPEDSATYLPILDTHGENIRTEVYELFELVLKRCSVSAVLLERDSNFPEFEELVQELKELGKIKTKIFNYEIV